MDKKKHPHAQILDDLGGPTAVSKLTGASRHSVGNWRNRGIPWHWRARIKQLAEAHGVDVPNTFLGIQEPAE